MNQNDLYRIETYLDVPRGTLAYWLAEENLRTRARGATEELRTRTRRGNWLARLGAR